MGRKKHPVIRITQADETKAQKILDKFSDERIRIQRKDKRVDGRVTYYIELLDR